VTRDNAEHNAAAELARARLSLRAAEVLAREGLTADAVSDAYYAGFHAVRALLFSIGEEPRSHSGAIHSFNMRFIRPGKVDAKHLSALARAQHDRTTADYGAGAAFSADDALEQISSARALIEEVERLLATP
jgi:uncharacterized protein (UPF0332 family)